MCRSPSCWSGLNPATFHIRPCIPWTKTTYYLLLVYTHIFSDFVFFSFSLCLSLSFFSPCPSVFAPAGLHSHFQPCTHMHHISFHLPNPLFLKVSHSQCLFQEWKGKRYIHIGKECDQRTGDWVIWFFSFAVLFRFLQREM